MKIVQINATSIGGSTGKICNAVSSLLSQKGVENYILYSLYNGSTQSSIKFSNTPIRYIQALFEKLFGNSGFGNHISTLILVNKLKQIKPDIVHLHNIHSHDVNLTMLFGYLKSHNIKVFWTFHDCWAFTGGCAHFDGVKCEKWEMQCGDCPIFRRNSYYLDRTRKNYNKKKVLYGGGVDLTIITPSKWLGDVVKKSFLKNYPVKVINNGIDFNVFHPVSSDFRRKYNIEDKFILLGVAFEWSEKKGLDVFLQLSADLLEVYQIVLVGTNSEVDKALPSNIISIHKTNNQQELAEIYSAADVFLQLTREENFPTVNIEALACGTPVITFDTGGSPEIIDESCGLAVEKNEYKQLTEGIEYVRNYKPYTKDSCIKRSRMFEQDSKFKEYLRLYNV